MTPQSTAEHVIPEQHLQPYYDKIAWKADRISTGFMIGFFLTGILLSFFHSTFLTAILMGGGSLIVFFIVRAIAPHTQALRMLTGFLFWNFGLQFLLQMRGLHEMKFVF